jgi:hypothetical protein
MFYFSPLYYICIGLLKQIDSGPRGIVYGVNRNDQIYCRKGITDSQPWGVVWQRVPGELKYVSCGNLGCWGVNKNDQIWFRHGVTSSNCDGTTWANIPGSLKQIEVSFFLFMTSIRL